ncbi:MAG: hypothetical protein WC389_17565, partial [Lutibacter sp.]
MEAAELLTSVVTKIYSRTEDEVKPLIFAEDGTISDKAFENLLTLDAARVTRFKAENTERFNNGHKKGKEETYKAIENTLKEKTGISEGQTIEEIIEAFVAQTSTKTGKPLTEDEIKKHPLYLAVEKDRVPKTEFERVQKEFEDYKIGIDRRQRVDTKKQQAIQFLTPDKYKFPENEDRKRFLLGEMLAKIEAYDYEGDLILKDGKRLEDQHYNPITFEKFVTGLAANYFDVLVTPPSGGAGNRNNSPLPGSVDTNYNYQTQQEWDLLFQQVEKKPE